MRRRWLLSAALWLCAPWLCAPGLVLAQGPPPLPAPDLLDRAAEALSAPFDADRSAAARSLGRLPPSARALALLRGALSDPSSLVVAAALDAAVEARAVEVGPEVVAATRHPAPEVRALACAAAAALGLTDAAATQALLGLLIDPDPSARAAAAAALGALQAVEAAPLLAALLDDRAPAVAAAAAAALTPWAATSPSARDAFIARAREGTYAQRLDAIRALGVAAHPAATATLLRLIADEQPDLRRAALSALESLRDPASVDSLLAWLRPDARDSGFAPQVAFALGQVGDPRAVPALLAWGARNPDGWPLAASALAAIGGPSIGPVTQTLRVTPDAPTQRALIALLGRVPDLDAAAWLGQALTARRYPTPWLIDALTRWGLQPDAPPPPPDAVTGALLALPDIEDAALAALLDALTPHLDARWLLPLLSRLGPDWGSAPAPLRLSLLRWWATAHPAAIGPPPPALIAALRASLRPDQPLAHQRLAATATARLLPADALPLLTPLLAAPDPTTAAYAADALASLASSPRAPEDTSPDTAEGALSALLDACATEPDPEDGPHPLAVAAACAAAARPLSLRLASDDLRARAVDVAADLLDADADDADLPDALAAAARALLTSATPPDLAARWRDLWAADLGSARRLALLRAATLSPAATAPAPATVAAALRDPHPDVRAEAAWLLGLLPDAATWPGAAPALIDALADPHLAARANAAASLGRLPPSDDARAALRRHLLSPHPITQANALWALSRLDPAWPQSLSPHARAVLRARATHPLAQAALADALGLPPPWPPAAQGGEADPAWFLLSLAPHPDTPGAHLGAPVSLRLPDGSARSTTSDPLGQVFFTLDPPGRVRLSAGFPFSQDAP